MNALVFGIEFLVLMFVGQYVLNLNTTNFDDNAAIRGGNQAVKIRRYGAFIALALAISAAFIGSYTGELVHDAIQIGLYGAIGIASILLGIFKSDYLLSPGLQNNAAIKAGNKAVAIFEAYTMASIGIITFAAWAHDGTMIGGLIYYIIGLAMFYVIGIVYRSKHDAAEIEIDQNSSTAHRKGTILLGYAIILWACMFGPLEEHISILTSLLSFLSIGFVAMVSYIFVTITISGLVLGLGNKYARYEPYISISIALIFAVLIRYLT